MLFIRQKHPYGCFCLGRLLLPLFVLGVSLAPLTEFLKFDFSLYFLLVFARPIVHVFTRCALEFNKEWLWHIGKLATE